jgi:hypothetical protein
MMVVRQNSPAMSAVPQAEQPGQGRLQARPESLYPVVCTCTWLSGVDEGDSMKRLVVAAIVVFACAGFVSDASAQVRTTPAGKLFFEGDIVSHNLDNGAPGPFCVLKSRFMRGEAVAWRQRILQPNGTPADDKVLKSVVVELGSGQKVPLDYGPHGNPPTDFFWANSWTIPQNHPTGSVGYKIVATMQDGTVVTWEPFTRPNSQFWVIEGTPGTKTASAQ